MPVRVNIVGRTIHAWIFKVMVDAIARHAGPEFEVDTSPERLPGYDLYHWFRVQEPQPDQARGAVVEFHGTLPGATTVELQRGVFEAAAAICAVSRQAVNDLTEGGIDLGRGRSGRRIYLIEAGADPQRFTLRKAMPEGRFTVGIVGRRYGRHGAVLHRKGEDVIVPILERLAATICPVQALFVGANWGDTVQTLKAAGVDAVHHDRQGDAGADMDVYAKLYHSMDALLVASRYEGGPVCVVEAMMSGVPVVGTPVGVFPQFVNEGTTGFTFPIDDVAGAVECLTRIAGERQTWFKRRAAIRRRVVRYTWERYGRLHGAVYRQVLGRGVQG